MPAFPRMIGFLLRTREVPDGEGPQTERMLRWIVLGVLIGAFAILIGTIFAGLSIGIGAAVRFFAVGLLAALMALVLGGALGLLFGLPIANGASARQDGTRDADSKANWFGDNTAMEQIVDWLTKIIVGLGLVQAHDIALQFDRIATATSRAMGVTDAGSADATEVLGGAIILAYLALGFVGLFLWARRYLKLEWTDEREQRGRVASRQEERLILDRSDAANTRQRSRRSAPPPAAVRAAFIEANPGDGPDAAFPAVVQPGGNLDDPWAGQFGGRAAGSGLVLEASVAALPSKDDLFGVKLVLRGVDKDARQGLIGQRARVYLHPTFPDPIRMLTFDAAGEIKLTLVCWGSFTVGTQLRDAKDERGLLLELDLAKLPDAPVKFRER